MITEEQEAKIHDAVCSNSVRLDKGLPPKGGCEAIGCMHHFNSREVLCACGRKCKWPIRGKSHREIEGTDRHMRCKCKRIHRR